MLQVEQAHVEHPHAKDNLSIHFLYLLFQSQGAGAYLLRSFGKMQIRPRQVASQMKNPQP